VSVTRADLLARITACLDENPTLSAREIGRRVVRDIPDDQWRDMLAGLVAELADAIRRSRAHQVEREARERAQMEEYQARMADLEKRRQDLADLKATRFTRLYDDPLLWPRPIWFNAVRRAAFRAWVAKQDGGFSAWLKRGLDGDPSEEFKRDWVPGYEDEQLIKALTPALGRMAAQIRFEVTAELLDTVFATGDGTRVSWRDATVAQHEERIEMLSKMIAGTAETAAMHMRAIEMIKDAGVDTLGQLGGSNAPR
jgi:hypothetical protein